jgi:uncharacterized protein (DUF2235 family)
MKRIITCSDGTWNKPGVIENGKLVQTNVQKMFEAICKKVTPEHGETIYQIKYYDEGVGSAGTAWSKLIDGATGKGIDDNIKDAYKFIVWNYEPGDELFLFGFSRGAYTARSVAGLIRNCGILKNNDLTLIDKAYQIYRNRGDATLDPKGATATTFRNENSHPLERIKFVGVWDTVGALGIPVRSFQWLDKKEYQFHDTTLSSLVANAYHALALDEKRRNFEPALWNADEKAKPINPDQVMEQVWFAGAHSNVGGGYPECGLSDIALSWLIDKSKICGLGFDEAYLEKHIHPDHADILHNPKTGIFSLLPDFHRPVRASKFTNEAIHQSVYQRISANPTYRPRNLDIPAG